MADDQPFCTEHVLRYLLYIALIAVCLAGILYLLMHAQPQVAPKVKDSTSSRLVLPSDVDYS